MPTNVSIKRNDTGVSFTDTLTVNGAAVDLTGATVLFLMRLRDGKTVFSQTATIVDAGAGQVAYGPGALPTTPGLYEQEWQVTLAGGNILTFPSDGYNTVDVLDDLNAS
jgi:hypothetical protein